MRSLSLRTLLFLLPVFLLLNCSQAKEQPTTSISSDITVPQPGIAISQAPEVEASGSSYPDHLQLALQYEGVTELTGQNDGPQVKRFLQAVGLNTGNPYCAAFVSFTLDESQDVKLPKIRSALASDFITDRAIEAREVIRGHDIVPPGSVVIWRKGNTIFGHAGLVIRWEQERGQTIEANTSAGAYGNQRDGEGVYRRDRLIQPGNYFRITHFTPVIYAKG